MADFPSSLTACYSLSGNAKWSKSQAAAENASIYSLMYLSIYLFIAMRALCLQSWLWQAAKPEPAGASGWPPEIAKQRCLTCAAYAKWRIGLEEGEAKVHGIYVP